MIEHTLFMSMSCWRVPCLQQQGMYSHLQLSVCGKILMGKLLQQNNFFTFLEFAEEVFT